MSVGRIKNINIDDRELFTGVYGYSAQNETYIEKDLSQYHILQELYLYLHEMGYVCLFYNKANNFFSYQEKDMEDFFFPDRIDDKPTQQTPALANRHPRCRGPLGAARVRRTATQSSSSQQTSSALSREVISENTDASTGLASHNLWIITGGNPETGYFYQQKRKTEGSIFKPIYNFVDKKRDKKLAVVFTNPETTEIGDEETTKVELTNIRQRMQGQGMTNMPLRIITLYPATTPSALSELFNSRREFFFNSIFKNYIFPGNTDASLTVNDSVLFSVDKPQVDEIGNVLNYRRLMQGMQHVFDKPWDVVTRNLSMDFPMRDAHGNKINDSETSKPRQIQSVNEMMGMDKSIFELSLTKLSVEGGRQKLDKLLGMDAIREHLDAYVKEFHKFRNGETKNFIPHIALTGNPGTGKTTVARIIGEILREEGLLTSGHLIETTPGGLIGQYVGQTRVKTGEVCQRARGGILFIDEAYGLCPDNNGENHGADFGKEAIDTLLAFMLSEDRNSVVIFAGYPKEIEYLLKNGNPGLDRRVPYKWNIADYKPEVLYQIAMKSLGERETTEEFRNAVGRILGYKYAMRSSKTWGNAGSAEEIIQKISTSYSEMQKTGPMDVDCIPEEYMRHIKDITPEEKTALFAELDTLIGLDTVKSELHALVDKIDFQRLQMKAAGSSAVALENLNFVFSGNPGTGKTTVARMLGKILFGMGLLDAQDVIEADVANINNGDPAHNIMEYMDKAVGKVLFIDEAYSLVNQGNTIAIDALTKALTDENYKGKMAVVLAGYSNDMTKMLRGNRGLTSRFPNQIHFEDYNNEELWRVLKLQASHAKPLPLNVPEECHPYAVFHFSQISREKFSNAREVENLLKTLTTNMGRRVDANGGDLFTILPADFNYNADFKPEEVKISNGVENVSPFDKLNNLNGVDDIKKQFEKFLRNFRYAKTHPQGIRFRPHMAFMGNPGTGKTTVARIFGEILREEHLLENGNFIEAKAEDFVGQYIGESAQKAKAKCEEARGGIMFIDEAHHFYRPDNHQGFNYEKEALRVILTELESRSDTLYIFAGYTKEMNEFLDKADGGMRSRIPNIITFKDYDPQTLNKIVRAKLGRVETTSEFDEMLRLAVENQFNMRNPHTFGNARDMENMAGEILSLYRDRHNGEGPLIVDCIPDKYQSCLRDMTTEEEDVLMANLNDMVGLEMVKNTLTQITKSAKGAKIMIKEGLLQDAEPENLTFLFMGNPGTGKTTVARMVGQILHGYGFLSSDEVKEYAKDDILDQYVGGTQENVTKMFDDCFGRVMFIDEAYSLAKDNNGKEALDQIVANMTSKDYMGKMAIILVGYNKEMTDMLNSNSGLERRFKYKVIFEDYTNDQLWQILEKNITGKGLSINAEQCKPFADAFFDVERRKGPNFGNAGTCINLVENVLAIHKCKLAESPEITPELIRTVHPQDFPNYEEARLLVQARKAGISDEDIQKTVNNVRQMTSAQQGNGITIDCTLDDQGKRVNSVEDLENATGLLKSSNGEGTGFVISIKNKYILTCSHVIEQGNDFEFKMRSGNFSTHAHVVWSNYIQDQALLQVDELPDYVHQFELDSNIDVDPAKLTKLILCGYPDGTAFASGVSLIEGAINNYEKNRQWNDRQFDTIYANVSATHGCSGGPVVRRDDFVVVGLLQGGKEGGEIQFITDVHQLFRHINIKK